MGSTAERREEEEERSDRRKRRRPLRLHMPVSVCVCVSYHNIANRGTANVAQRPGEGLRSLIRPVCEEVGGANRCSLV